MLTKFNIVKSAGPNSKLTESLKILSMVADYKLSLEKIYEKHAPRQLRVSTNTIHRILHYIRLGLTRRQGTALIITQRGKGGYFLVGNDQSLSDSALGNKGDISLPMGHSRTGENPKESITRVLQQEVFTDQAITGNFPFEVVPQHPRPIMYMNIADIRVAVFHIELTKSYPFSSNKIQNIRLVDLPEIKNKNTRPGVYEILTNYYPHPSSSSIPEYSSTLNALLYSMIKNEK